MKNALSLLAATVENVTFVDVLSKLNFRTFDLYEIAAIVFSSETLPNDVSIVSLL